MRGGIKLDLAIVIVLEIVLLSAAILVAGHGLSFYVQRGLDDIIGGTEYQVIVQVDKKETKNFVEGLKEVYSGRDGFKFRVSKELGENIHILLGYSEEDLKNGALDEVAKLISHLPGYGGLAPLLDPAVLVKGMPQDTYPELVEEIHTWPEVKFAAKGPLGLYVVAKNRRNLNKIEDKLEELTSKYYRWEIELKDYTNQQAAEIREMIDEALKGTKYWFTTPPAEGVIGDAVRLLKSYTAQLTFAKELPVGSEIALTARNLKVGTKADADFKARVYTDGIYLIKGDSLNLTGSEKAYLLDGSGTVKEVLPEYTLESPRRDLDVWEPKADARNLKASIQSLADKVVQGEDFGILIREIEQLAKNLSLEVPSDLKSQLSVLVLWDRVGRLPGGFREELAQKLLQWAEAMPSDPLIKLKESLPSWSDEDIAKSWQEIEAIARPKTISVITTGSAPPIDGVISKPAAEISEDIKSQIGGVVNSVVPFAALTVVVILLWVFTAVDHTLWGSYLDHKNNYLAPLYGWLLGVLEMAVVVYIMPFEMSGMVKLIYVAVGGLGSAVLITFSSRISPLNAKSIEAGEALGLSQTELYRQVVVPEGRPGLWQLLNRRKLLSPRRFKNA